jgi:hypothetical protein
MNDEGSAHRRVYEAIASWLMEASVLAAILPFVEQPLSWRLAAFATFALIAGAAGLYLKYLGAE